MSTTLTDRADRDFGTVTTRHAELRRAEAFGTTLGRALRRIADATAAHRRARATATALARLDDVQLHDIGVERGQIGDIAKAVARSPELELTAAELAEMREFPLPPLRPAQLRAANSNEPGQPGAAVSRGGMLKLWFAKHAA